MIPISLLSPFFFFWHGEGIEEEKEKEVESRRCGAKECNPLQWNAEHFTTILAKAKTPTDSLIWGLSILFPI